VDASGRPTREMRRDFEEAIAGFRKAAAERARAERASGKAPERKPDDPVAPVGEWRKGEPLKLLRVSVTGRSNFGVLMAAAFRLLFTGRTTFTFRKPVRETT